MVVHEAIRKRARMSFFQRTSEVLEQCQAILVIQEDVALLDSTCSDVVQGTGIFEAFWTGHCVRLAPLVEIQVRRKHDLRGIWRARGLPGSGSGLSAVRDQRRRGNQPCCAVSGEARPLRARGSGTPPAASTSQCVVR